MPDVAVAGTPASMNQLTGYFQFNGAVGAGSILVLPLMEGTSGSPTKNFERSPVLRADRQGGSQIGGTGAAEATIVVPVCEESAFKLLLSSLLRNNWSTPEALPTTKPAGRLTPGTGRRPFTLELVYTTYDNAGLPIKIYEKFLNCEPNRATITVPTSGAASASFEILGTAATVTNTPLSATAADFYLLEGAVPMASSLTGAKFGYQDTLGSATTDKTLVGAETVTITLDNNGEIKYRIGSATADHVAQGDFDAQFQSSIYYRNFNLLGFFMAETRKWFQVACIAGGDVTTCNFHLPQGVINEYTHATSGPTVTESITIFGEYSNDADALSKFFVEYV
jgi:hypothetical protein